MSVKIFYYPRGNHLVEIDMQECLGELFSDREYSVVDGVSVSGGIRRSITGGREFVTFQRDNFTLGKDLAYQFDALQSHLDRGGSCMIAADYNKMFCFPLSGNPLSGSRSFSVGAPPFVNIVGASSIPAVGDYMKIETDVFPVILHEKVKVFNVGSMTATGGSITFDQRIKNSYSRRSFLMSEHFFPILKRPAEDVGKKMVTSVGDRLFTLNVQLVVDYETLFAYHPDNPVSYGNAYGIGSGLTKPFQGAGNLPQTGDSGGWSGGLDWIADRYYDIEVPEYRFTIEDRILE